MLVDKPTDYTSADIVRIFKKKFKIKKIGHTGTLDPKATGLLILCTDKMTKEITKLIETEKEYEGIFRIGATTKTFDTESEEENIVPTKDISEELIILTAHSFIGESEQIPPIYSAIKYKGKPLYTHARKGKKVELKPRRIFISKFDVKKLNETEVYFKIICSKGTYIRTIANDFGQKLGCGAYLKSLRRTRIGNFVLENFNENLNGIPYKILENLNNNFI
ncbi:MAG: tRNA pseudouridine(55) synthase TruB [Ignavibacteria bacterium]|nr:tRNA pseudouridine(55) synthase TruB [Ignavibacteria bacterium]